MIIPEEPVTEEQLSEKQAKQIVSQSNRLYDMIKSRQRQLFQQVWYSKNPQAVFDTLGGEKTLKLFQASQATELLLKSLDDSYEFLEIPYEFTLEEDGTVVVGEMKEGFENPINYM